MRTRPRAGRLPTTEATHDDILAGAPAVPVEGEAEAVRAATVPAHDAEGGAGAEGAGDGDGVLPEDEPERGPLRRCIVTREQGERERMLRFVIGPERRVVPDLGARLPGRGIWLSARADVVENAKIRGAFARAARGPVTVPADLPALLQAGLAARVGDFVGFARRAGEAVAGFAKAREWLQSGRAVLVLEASDGSVDERARLLSGVRWSMLGTAKMVAEAVGDDVPGGVADVLADAVEAGEPEGDAVLDAPAAGRAGGRGPSTGGPPRGGSRGRIVRVATPLDAARLGAVFGRDHVVHVAVAAGRLAEMLAIETERLSGVTGRNGTGA